ncbi:MAG: DUF6808 domain-containing protein [Bacteroidales bacterium]
MISLDYIKLYARVGGIVILFLLTLIGLFSIDRCKRTKDPESKIIVRVDTLYLHDTLRIDKLVPVITRTTDTFLVRVTDTIRIKDTLYLNLPREQKIYREENFQAWISGYRPALDSIHIFRNTHQVITSTTIHQKPTRPRRWGIGLQVGYGLTLQQNAFKPVPYIGVGLSYTILYF